MCPPNISVMGVRIKSAWRVMEVLFLGPTCSHSSSLPSSSLSAASSSTPGWDSGPLDVGASGQAMKKKQILNYLRGNIPSTEATDIPGSAHPDHF